jgi:6-phosphofructokinase 1
VINNSLVGVVREALQHDCIEGIYGARWGIRGVLDEHLLDLRREQDSVLEALRYTPSAALGTVRYKLVEEDYARILEVFRAHNVRYFLYIGGNDSMNTAHRVHQLAEAGGYELRAIGIPKTVDNDLAHTDHCPGYGSAARFVSMAIRDTGWDTESMGASAPVKIMEIMGRDAGWLTASAALAKHEEQDAPHLVYVPERPVSIEQIGEDTLACLEKYGRAVIALSEGARDESGETIGAGHAAVDIDAFGHRLKGGAVEYLSAALKDLVGTKVRYDRPNYLQRSFAAAASTVDRDEAYRAGESGVREAVAGHSNVMVTLVREPGPEYHCTTGLAPLCEIADVARGLPDDFMNGAGNFPTDAFLEYARPLIGEPLAQHARLAKVPIPKKA